MEGRDIGTVIFPDAFCKIYLEASPEVRARRRLLQLQTEGSAKDSSLTYDWVLEDIRIRDERDMNREIAPLKMAPDSLLLETSTLDKDEVVDTLVAMAKAQAKRFGLEFGNGKVA
jgi:cytidylate kinase